LDLDLIDDPDQEYGSGSGIRFQIRNPVPDKESGSGSGIRFRIRNPVPDQESSSGSGILFRIRNPVPDPGRQNCTPKYKKFKF
jgi:hypothetical protein